MDLGYPLTPSEFGVYLVRRNGLDTLGFETWVFHPGMLFSSTERWWGGGGARDRPHEGLDFCWYRDRSGRLAGLNSETVVPALYGGEVAGIHNDFLGKSVYVFHGVRDVEGSELYTIYGHMEPDSQVRPGLALAGGETFGTIADASERNPNVAPHLHVSVAWIPRSFARGDIDWAMIVDSAAVRLVNPLEVIPCDYVVLGREQA
jgi:hypothetical protein